MIIRICIVKTIGVGTPPSETRGTHLTVTHGMHYQPDRHHPDFPKDIHDALLLSGLPQKSISDVSASLIRTASRKIKRHL